MKRHKVINKLTAAVLAIAVFAASFAPQNVFAEETFYNCYSRTPDADLLGATEYYICYREFRTYEDTAVFKLVHSIVARAADHAWFSSPVISGCDYCKGRYRDTDLYSARIWAENQDGTIVAENNGLSITNCNTTGTKARYVLELTIHPKEKCEHCGKRIGSFMYVNDFHLHEQVITFKSQPKNTSATEGGAASFDVQADYHDTFYRWQKFTDGSWSTLKEGAAAGGEEYTGTNTAVLTINNVRSSLDSAKYRCMMMGANGNYVYTNEAKLSVASAPVTTPTQAPTPDPVTTPAPTPYVTPIIPGGGSGQGTYTPASSSSQYTAPTPVPTQSGGATVTSSTVKNTSEKTPTYNGTITPVPAGTGTGTGTGSAAVTPALNASASAKQNTAGQKGPKGQKSSSATSSSSYESASSSARGGQHTIMKNGVLYIIDDEDAAITAGENLSSSTVEESVDADTAYSAADLAVDGTLTEKTREPGFFETGPGIATIIASALLILLLLLFFLFFGVIVFGEVEEHDEVFELCGIRLLRRKDDNWCVNLGEVFEDNAVVKLRLGILFTVIFDGADLVGMTKGMYEGTVTGPIQQNMELCRRNVRRSV